MKPQPIDLDVIFAADQLVGAIIRNTEVRRHAVDIPPGSELLKSRLPKVYEYLPSIIPTDALAEDAIEDWR